MPAGIVAISYAPFVVLPASGVRASLDAQFGRSLELESLGGSLIVAAHAFFGLHLPDRGSYYELPFASADTVARISVVLGIAVLVGVWLLFLRSSASDVMLLTFAAAALATTLAFGKVFSPQYLLWLIPFVRWLRVRVAPMSPHCLQVRASSLRLSFQGIGSRSSTTLAIPRSPRFS